LLGGTGFYQRPEVRVLLAHLALLSNPRDEAALMLALEARRGVGPAAIGQVVAHARHQSLSPLEACAQAGSIRTRMNHRARESIAQFGTVMQALSAGAVRRSISSLVSEVMRLPGGPWELVLRDPGRLERMQALREAARTYERQ